MTGTLHRVTYNAGSTMALGYATLPDGTEVTFGGDWRPMRDLARMIEAGDLPEVDIPEWAVLRRTAPEAKP